jgi:intraflagellar transport protein 56
MQEAYDLIKDVEPSTPQEYILKVVMYARLGQSTASRQHNTTAQQSFQLVGLSPTECDTIPGRQCMVSCFYLLDQFEDAYIYPISIKQNVHHEDDFTWNFSISLYTTGPVTSHSTHCYVPSRRSIGCEGKRGTSINFNV